MAGDALVSGQARSDREPSPEDHAHACCSPVALGNASPYSSLSHDAQQYGHALPASIYTVAQNDPGRTTHSRKSI